MNKTRAAILVSILAIVGGFWSLSAASAKEEDKPKAIASEEVSRKEVTKPGETTPYAVARNGKVHVVHVKIKKFHIVYSDGGTATEVTEQGGVEELLPPVDPALNNVAPSDEDVRAALKAIGADGPPATP